MSSPDADDGVYFMGAAGEFPAVASAPSADVTPPAARASAPASASASAKIWAAGAERVRAGAVVASGSGAAGDASAAKVLRAADLEGNTICSYFASGLCRAGDTCRFRHVRAEPWAVEFFVSMLEAARAGTGDGAIPVFGTDAGGAATLAVPKGGVEESEAVFAAAAATWATDAASGADAMISAAVAAGVAIDADAADVALSAAERAASKDVECGICLENVTAAGGRRFGLLTGCTHAFCENCIREWRARTDLPTSTVRACPLCRVVSYYIIPCDRFVADASRKARVHASFLGSQKRVPCRNWDLGRGTCPFGSSCFYAHLLPDGSTAPVAAHGYILNQHGEISGVNGRGAKLSDFLSGLE